MLDLFGNEALEPIIQTPAPGYLCDNCLNDAELPSGYCADCRTELQQAVGDCGCRWIERGTSCPSCLDRAELYWARKR